MIPCFAAVAIGAISLAAIAAEGSRSSLAVSDPSEERAIQSVAAPTPAKPLSIELSDHNSCRIRRFPATADGSAIHLSALLSNDMVDPLGRPAPPLHTGQRSSPSCLRARAERRDGTKAAGEFWSSAAGLRRHDQGAATATP